MFNTVTYILFGLIFTYCGLSVLYLFVLSFFGKFFHYSKENNAMAEPVKKIAILVPAYKEDSIIFSTITNLTSLDYPSHLYDVYIIADSFKLNTIEELQNLPINLVKVSFAKSTKTKSLNEAFKRINKPYDIALICDADNMLAADFLKKINDAFVNGARAVQGRRVAKNLDSSYAVLDACSEAINNHIFRKGTNAIGLSSSVIGSGMAFDFQMIKEILCKINAVGGFDKILQLKVVEQNIKILYLNDAIIFDEKVGSSQAFKQQRKRWVSSQFIYLKQFFLPACNKLLKGKLSYFNLAIANNFVPPRAFLLLLLPLLILIAFFLQPVWIIAASSLLIIYLLSLLIALPVSLMNKELLLALYKLPKAVALMFSTLFQIKNANKTFIHTAHTKTEISNTLYINHGR